MADNLTVLNSTGGTFTIRMTDVGAGILANNSIPTSTSGSPMSVQAGAAVVSTAQGAAVVVVSSLSPSHLVTLSSASQVTLTSATVTLSSNPTVILSSNPTVILSSNPTITSVSSGAISIISGANTATVLAGSSTVTSTMSALVVAISSNGAGVIVTGTAGSPSSQFLSVQGSTSMTPLLVTSTGSLITPSSNITIGSGNISLVPTTSGGLSLSSVIMASGTNATLISSVARQVYKVECFNNSSNIGYLHLYNLSSVPTVGSSLVFDRYLVPGNASGTGVVSGMENGVTYTTGISYTFTGGIADSDTTAVAASAFIVNIYYK